VSVNPSSKPIIVAGPTGVGKSLFAVELATRLDGEIIGGDAYQVYSGLEILTAQPGPELRSRVPHHLIGFLPVSEPFDAARFRDIAQEKIAEVSARGRLPIVVGGSGMYLKALTHGLADIPAPNEALRAELSALSLGDLLRRLDEVDPSARQDIDCQNPRRVIRALEICLQTGRPLSGVRRQWSQSSTDFRGIFLIRDRQDLSHRIEENVRQMFHRGVVEEVRQLPPVVSTAAKAIGLSDILALLRGEITEARCLETIMTTTRQYAKRQLTWFRNQSTFFSIDLTASSDTQTSLSIALEALGEA